jgi:hypothetical protein
MTIFDAVLTLGLTIIQPPEKRAKVFVGCLLIDLVFYAVGLR